MRIIGTMMAAAVLSTTAFAGHQSNRFSFLIGGGYTHLASGHHLDNATSPVFGAAYDLSRRLSASLMVVPFASKAKNTARDSVNSQLYTLNGRYHFQVDQKLQPYLTAGLGVVHIRYPTGLVSNSNTETVMNAGGGAQYFFSPSIALEAGARDAYAPATGRHDLYFHVGYRFFFGGNQMSRGADVGLGQEQLATFTNNSAQIQPSMMPAIKQFAKKLQQQPKVDATLQGHASSVGPSSYNLRLSKQRAENVADVLAQSGVSRDRLTVVGLGEENPVGSNQTASGRAANRRVDGVIH